MTTSSAAKVVRIMCGADGECYICAAKLVVEFIRQFPEHEQLARDLYAGVHNNYAIDEYRPARADGGDA